MELISLLISLTGACMIMLVSSGVGWMKRTPFANGDGPTWRRWRSPGRDSANAGHNMESTNRSSFLKKHAISVMCNVLLVILSLSLSIIFIFSYTKKIYVDFLSGISQRYQGDPPLVPDAETGFATNSGGLSHFFLTGSDRSVSVAANPQGLRVAPERRREILEHADVLAIGCSFTFGYGVEAEQAYPAIAGNTSGYVVANGAVPGYGTLGALRRLQHLAGLHPKLVIYGFIAPHLKRNLSPCGSLSNWVCRSQAHVTISGRGPEIVSPQGDGWGQRLVFSLLKRQEETESWADGWRGLVLLVGRAYSKLVTPAMQDTPHNEATALAFLLRKMKEETDAIGAKLVVLYLPYLPPRLSDDVPRGLSGPPDILVEALPPGVELIDMAPPLRRASTGQSLRLLPDDGHPNVLAHRLMGEDLGYRLRSGLLPK